MRHLKAPRCTAVTRSELPLRTGLVSASAVAQAVARRYPPMISVLSQQEQDHRPLGHHLDGPCSASGHHHDE